MNVCQYCGRELEEGEVCFCQDMAVESLDIKKKMKKASSSNKFNGKLYKIIAEPEESIRTFVLESKWKVMGSLILLYGCVQALFRAWEKVDENLKRLAEIKVITDRNNMDFDTYVERFAVPLKVYENGEIFKGIVIDIFQVTAELLLFVLFLYFSIRMIAKIEVSWKMVLGIATIGLLVQIPFSFIYEILALVPKWKIVAWIMSGIASIKAFGSAVLTYLGLKVICKDVKSSLYVSVVSYSIWSMITPIFDYCVGLL